MTTEKRPRFRDERDAWRFLQRDTKASSHRRAWGDRQFLELFPEGHRTSIRDFVELYADTQVGRDYSIGIDSIHPDAYDLLLAYGTDFEPQEFTLDVYQDTFQPVPGQCFRNAWLLMERSPTLHESITLEYVEGVVIGSFTQPMLHAWNAPDVDRTLAIDWSFYATTMWSRYFGISFTKVEYDEITLKSGRPDDVSLLFHCNHFKVFEAALRAVLERRNKKPAA